MNAKTQELLEAAIFEYDKYQASFADENWSGYKDSMVKLSKAMEITWTEAQDVVSVLYRAEQYKLHYNIA